MSTPTFEVSSEKIPIQAEPLTPEGFEPFGSVISPGHLGNDGEANSVAANQGTAVKFIEVSTSQSLYDNAPSGKIPSHTNWNLFRCSPPVHLMTSAEPSDSQEAESPAQIEYLSKVLERHPFSTQTFLPLGRSKDQQGYLVIVSLKNPETGLPDLDTVRAFIANGNQAVTYGVGTWHAPMVALGSTLDFAVLINENGVSEEDCQEVYLNPGMRVRYTPENKSKL